jgi:hypothetical protein
VPAARLPMRRECERRTTQQQWSSSGAADPGRPARTTGRPRDDTSPTAPNRGQEGAAARAPQDGSNDKRTAPRRKAPAALACVRVSDRGRASAICCSPAWETVAGKRGVGVRMRRRDRPDGCTEAVAVAVASPASAGRCCRCRACAVRTWLSGVPLCASAVVVQYRRAVQYYKKMRGEQGPHRSHRHVLALAHHAWTTTAHLRL